MKKTPFVESVKKPHFYYDYEYPNKSSAYNPENNRGKSYNSPSNKDREEKRKKLKKQLNKGEITRDEYNIEIDKIKQEVIETNNKKFYIEKEVESEKKEKLFFVIIEDQTEIREKIKFLLPGVLDEFDLEFEEMDNYQDAKNKFKYSIIFSKRVFYILDNTFFEEKGDNWPKANMGKQLYKWIEENKPEYLRQIAIFSSYDEDDIRKSFGENVEIIPGKSSKYSDEVHIKAIAKWVKKTLNN